MNGQPEVGILTYHFADNFGAVLQAYALQQYLAELELDPYFIDYDPDHVSRGGQFWLPTNKKRVRANLIIAYQKYIQLRSRISGNQGQRQRFSDFRNKHLRIRGKHYKTLKELRSHPPECHAYVCGSDQIWNASPQYGVDPAYFLDFGAESVRKVSYAASFGKATVEKCHQAEIAGLLKKFDHVSVREESGVGLVAEMAGIEAQWMPDPTLLLDDYAEVTAEETTGEGYLMSYVLREGGYIQEVLKHLSEKLDLKILVPHTSMKRLKGLGQAVHPGPSEWLALIKGAGLVVTNSFHGTVFSILFQKPFLSVGLAGKHSQLSERAVSLLGRLGLMDRFITSYQPEKIEELAAAPIDWPSVQERLESWRIEAKDYLQLSLLAGSC